MSIVPTDVWVVANFKESQLKKMMPGQPATVEIDALGGRKFRAHVDSVQAGSGAAFSLLPPENATGNFVKVVQRVPVKIVFDEPLPAGPHDRPRAFRRAGRAGRLVQRAGFCDGDCGDYFGSGGGVDFPEISEPEQRERSNFMPDGLQSGMASAPQSMADHGQRDAGGVHGGAGHVHRQHRAAAHRAAVCRRRRTRRRGC